MTMDDKERESFRQHFMSVTEDRLKELFFEAAALSQSGEQDHIDVRDLAYAVARERGIEVQSYVAIGKVKPIDGRMVLMRLMGGGLVDQGFLPSPIHPEVYRVQDPNQAPESSRARRDKGGRSPKPI